MSMFFSSIGAYNSLLDPHLNQYFRKPQVKQHLVQAGLVSREYDQIW